jgi:hypothetical protein
VHGVGLRLQSNEQRVRNHTLEDIDRLLQDREVMHEVLSTRHTDEPLSPEMGIGLILAVRLPSLIACDGSERESGAGGLTREVEAPLPSNHPRRRAEHRSNRIPHRAMLHTVPVEYHTVLCRTEAMALLGMTRTAPCGIDCGSTAAAARGLAALHRSPPCAPPAEGFWVTRRHPQSIERERRLRQALEEAVAFHASASGSSTRGSSRAPLHLPQSVRRADVASLVPHWGWVLAIVGVPAVLAALYMARSWLRFFELL